MVMDVWEQFHIYAINISSLLELYRAMKKPSGKANLTVYNYLVVVIN